MTNPDQIYRLYTILAADAVKDMKGNRGRMVTQGGHGLVHALWDAMDRFPADCTAYRAQGSAFKMALVVPDAASLERLFVAYQPLCGVSLVREQGTRVNGDLNVEVQSTTALGLGPIRSDLVGDDLRALKPFL